MNKGDERRRRPGPDTLEERIGKAADSRKSPNIYTELYSMLVRITSTVATATLVSTPPDRNLMTYRKALEPVADKIIPTQCNSYGVLCTGY
jgi:hypothetical protein